MLYNSQRKRSLNDWSTKGLRPSNSYLGSKVYSAVLWLKLCINNKRMMMSTVKYGFNFQHAYNARFFFYIFIKCNSNLKDNNTSNINYSIAIFHIKP